MRHRFLVLTLSVVSAAAVLLCWQRNVYDGESATVAPYTAHLTITKNRILPDGSSLDTVLTKVLARDRQGRTSDKTLHKSLNGDQWAEWFSFFVQDPAKLETIAWDSKSRTVVVGHWPYWSGRKGCWADKQGQHQSSFPSDEDWYKVPASPGDGKLQIIASIITEGDKRIKTRIVTENLGQKEIHGLTAFGMRTAMTPLESGEPSALPEHTTELWKSTEFDLKLLQVTSGPKYGSERMELSDLQRGDPDPALFDPPQNYRVETIEYHQGTCGQK
jgi:hypothetical protein